MTLPAGLRVAANPPKQAGKQTPIRGIEHQNLNRASAAKSPGKAKSRGVARTPTIEIAHLQSHALIETLYPRPRESDLSLVMRASQTTDRHAAVGYVRDPLTNIAVPDPKLAPLVHEAFERYATGQESDLTIAQWLNATGARTARNRPFGKDAVRGILSNATYCGYVTGKRDTALTTKGLHEAIVSAELFDRVQQVRSWRNRVLKDGPPSEDYLLRKLLRCERCGARMHGTTGGSNAARRYMCSARRYGNPCGEPIVLAERLEQQLVGWIRDFKPDQRLIDRIVKAVEAERPKRDPAKAKRKELLGQLTRLQDLCVLGDLPKAQYVMPRQTIEEELQCLGTPAADPGIDRAKALLDDFAGFWEIETEPSERRKLLLSLFEQVWAQEGRIVAVQPHEDFVPYFQAAGRCRTGRGNERGAESGSDGGRTLDVPTAPKDQRSRSGASRRPYSMSSR